MQGKHQVAKPPRLCGGAVISGVGGAYLPLLAGWSQVIFNGLLDKLIQGHTFLLSGQGSLPVQVRGNADIEGPLVFLIRGTAKGFTHFQVAIDGVMERLSDLLNGASMKIQAVPDSNHRANKQIIFRTEFNRAVIALVFQHISHIDSSFLFNTFLRCLLEFI